MLKDHILRRSLTGQEQEVVGGGFNIRESFVGEMSQFVMFDRVLSAQEISSLANITGSSCKQAEGSIFSWTDVALGVQGSGLIRNQSWCLGSFSSLQYLTTILIFLSNIDIFVNLRFYSAEKIKCNFFLRIAIHEKN